MDEREARELLSAILAEYRKRSFSELLRLLTEQDTTELLGPSGAWYQVEIQAFSDDDEQNHLRVLGSIDDGGARAYFPLCDDFIIAKSGEFIGE